MSNIFTEFFSFVEAEWAKIFGAAESGKLAATIVTDINLIGSGLYGALAEFQAISGVDSAVVTKISADVVAIQTAATTVVTDIEANIAKPIVTQITADWASLVSVLPANLPATLAAIIKAVATILPYAEAAVGILTAGTAASSATVAAAQASGLSPDEARLILAGTKAD